MVPSPMVIKSEIGRNPTDFNLQSGFKCITCTAKYDENTLKIYIMNDFLFVDISY